MVTGDKKGRGFGYGSDGDEGSELRDGIAQLGESIGDVIKAKRKKRLKEKAKKEMGADSESETDTDKSPKKRSFIQKLSSQE